MVSRTRTRGVWIGREGQSRKNKEGAYSYRNEKDSLEEMATFSFQGAQGACFLHPQ